MRIEGEKPRVFISYRRGGGAEIARLIEAFLDAQGLDVFLDVDSLGGGHFDEQILSQIEAREVFILICSRGCFDRCNDPDDWVRRELEHAIALGKRIVPVMIWGFDWPATDQLPEAIREVVRHNAFEYSHSHWKQTQSRLLRLLDPSWQRSSPTGTGPLYYPQPSATTQSSDPPVKEDAVDRANTEFERASQAPRGFSCVGGDSSKLGGIGRLMKTRVGRMVAGCAFIMIALALGVGWSLRTCETTPDDRQGASVEANRAIAIPIRGEVHVRVQRARDIFSGKLFAEDKTIVVPLSGSGFLYGGSNFHALVTAAHVVDVPSNAVSVASGDGTYSIDDGYSFSIELQRLWFNELDLKPRRLLVDHALDIAVFELDRETVDRLELRPLQSGVAVVGREVRMWGTQGQSTAVITGAAEASAWSWSQTSKRCDVTGVRDGAVICSSIMGSEYPGGFIGGPVLDAQGAVVGLIIETSPDSTRCRSIESVDSVIARFAAESRPFPD